MNKTLEKILEDELFENEVFEGEGNLQIKNTSEGTKLPITVSGNSVQEVSVQGKNLLDMKWFTKNCGQIWSDKAMYNQRVGLGKLLKVNPSTSYTLSVNDFDLRYAVQQYNSEDELTQLKDSGWQTASSYTFTTLENTNRIWVLVSSPDYSYDITPEQVQQYKMQLEEGEVVTEYEPFVPDSPSPDYPSEIKNCGNINLKICNKNLINFGADDYNWANGKAHIEGSTITLTGSQAIGSSKRQKTKFKCALKQGTTLTYSVNVLIGEENFTGGWRRFSLNLYYTDGTEEEINVMEAPKTVTFTLSKNVKEICMYLGGSGIVTEEKQIVLGLQLEIGAEETEYVPHQGQTITFPLSEGQVLHKDDYLAEDGVHQLRNAKKGSGTTVTLEDAKENGEYMCSHKTSGQLNEKTLAFDIDVADAVIEYELEKEIITPYSEEQRKAYNKLKQATAYDEITNIICTDEVQCNFTVNAKISKIKKLKEEIQV